VIPLQRLTLENEHHYYRKDGKGDNFLDYFELEKAEGAAVKAVSYAVCRYGKAVLEKRYSPREQDYHYQRPPVGYFHLAQLEVPIPGESHKDVGHHQHQHSPNPLHLRI